MRRIEREHIEKRVTCTQCPNRYCLDCNPAGCPICHSEEFYTTHMKGSEYRKEDIDTIHSVDSDGDESFAVAREVGREIRDRITTAPGVDERNPNRQYRYRDTNGSLADDSDMLMDAFRDASVGIDETLAGAASAPSEPRLTAQELGEMLRSINRGEGRVVSTATAENNTNTEEHPLLQRWTPQQITHAWRNYF